MVFIVIGAIQAAKTAKLEYEKGKKRNEMISAVAGSSETMADRGKGNEGADHWFGTACPKELRPSPSASEQPVSHGAIGAWSRSQNVIEEAFVDHVEPVERPSHPALRNRSSPVVSPGATDRVSQSLALVSLNPPDQPQLPAVVDFDEIAPSPNKPRSRKPRPADGSYASLLESNPVQAKQPVSVAVEARPRRQKEKRVLHGSFEAAMRKEGITVPGKGKTGALKSLPPVGAVSRQQNSRQETKYLSASKRGNMNTIADGSFDAMIRADIEMESNGEPKAGSARKEGGDKPLENGCFEAVLRAEGGLRHTQSIPLRPVSIQSALSYPAGSKVRRGRVVSAGSDSRIVQGVNEVVPVLPPEGSSMSVAGSMKRRVTRR